MNGLRLSFASLTHNFLLHLCRKVVKEQLKSLGVNDQIKSLVAEKRNYKTTKGKEPGITKEQAIEELKV